MSSVTALFEKLHRASRRDVSPSLEVRRDRLSRLEALVQRHQEDFVTAIGSDFGVRARTETLSADVLLVLDGVREAKRRLKEWMAPRPARPHPLFLPSQAWVEYVPRGVVGVIAPWNYPVNLALAPVVGALAAGNRVLLKPSELTPATSAVLARAVGDRFTAEEFAVVEGGVEVAKEVTSLPLDHLFFTGSTTVGRSVARAAAENLVPVTLELGGKSPALVHAEARVAFAAERIAVGKLFNAGQTCIAPDYALVPRGQERAFTDAYARAIRAFAPNLEGLTSIINDRALARLRALLDDASAKGATIERLGDDRGRVMAPTVVTGVREDMLVMQDEIFGPILPVEVYDSVDDAVALIAKRPRPLAFYYFDDDRSRARSVLDRVVCGGACLNDTLVHFAQEHLPFGGVGASGMGAYHGRVGFETFSHARGVLAASRLSAARTFLTPPFGAMVNGALELLIRGAGRRP